MRFLVVVVAGKLLLVKSEVLKDDKLEWFSIEEQEIKNKRQNGRMRIGIVREASSLGT